MNKPLSILNYYRLNHRRINVVLAITFFSVLLQYALLVYVTTMVNLELKTPLEFLKSVSVIELAKPTREKRNQLIKHLQHQPVVTKVIAYEDLSIPISFGEGMLVFLKNPEIKPLLQPLNLNLIRGRLPRPGSRETVLHWRIAANRGIKIGDKFKVQYSEDGLLASDYRLTGLLDGKLLLGFSDLELYIQDYQLKEEQTELLIVPQPGQLVQVNRYLERQSQKSNQLSTSKELKNFTLSYINDLFLMTNTVHLIITGILALCAGFLFYLYFYQRRTEFGLLEALGHTRPRIVGRVFIEISTLNLLGFGSALGVALIGGWVLNRFILPTQGLALVLWEPGYFLKLLSTPLVVTCCSLTLVWRMLKQLDPISIIERGGTRTVVKKGKPLSNWQYLRNNTRRVGVDGGLSEYHLTGGTPGLYHYHASVGRKV